MMCFQCCVEVVLEQNDYALLPNPPKPSRLKEVETTNQLCSQELQQGLPSRVCCLLCLIHPWHRGVVQTRVRA